jgi:hypothetical protein
MGKKSRSGFGMLARIIFPRALKQFFGLNFLDADPDPGSEIFLTLNQGSGMGKFGSGINIPDPQHCPRVF